MPAEVIEKQILCLLLVCVTETCLNFAGVFPMKGKQIFEQLVAGKETFPTVEITI
jgi:hypothetical protein